MINHISMTFRYAELNNGIVTLNSDNIIFESLVVSNPLVKPRAITQLPEESAQVGKGCYRGLVFDTPFEDSITIDYDSYNTGEYDNMEVNLELPTKELDYGEIINKTTVVDDMVRTNIDFSKVSDVEPLVARYVLLQQFIGKGLASKYVVARAMDDYFDNHWVQLPIDRASGTIEAYVPWLRMSVNGGNRLLVEDDKVIIEMDGVRSELNPTDKGLDQSYSELFAKIKTLNTKDEVAPLITRLREEFKPREHDTSIVKDISFLTHNNILTLVYGGKYIPLDWKNTLTRIHEDVLAQRSEADDIISNIIYNDSYNAVTELMESKLTNGGIGSNYTIDTVKGGTITLNGETIRFVGSELVGYVDEVVSKAENFRIPTEFKESVAKAVTIGEIVDMVKDHIDEDGSVLTVDDMLDMLS